MVQVFSRLKHHVSDVHRGNVTKLLDTLQEAIDAVNARTPALSASIISSLKWSLSHKQNVGALMRPFVRHDGCAAAVRALLTTQSARVAELEATAARREASKAWTALLRAHRTLKVADGPFWEGITKERVAALDTVALCALLDAVAFFSASPRFTAALPGAALRSAVITSAASFNRKDCEVALEAVMWLSHCELLNMKQQVAEGARAEGREPKWRGALLHMLQVTQKEWWGGSQLAVQVILDHKEAAELVGVRAPKLLWLPVLDVLLERCGIQVDKEPKLITYILSRARKKYDEHS